MQVHQVLLIKTANYGAIVAGHGSAIATAEQLSKTETYRDPDIFADIVRGMHLYGRKILRPEAIVTAKYNNDLREDIKMATFDMTAKATAGVGANIIAVPTVVGHPVRTIEAILDIDAMIATGATIADGDVFQLLEIPAESVVLCAGAEVMKQFTASCVAELTSQVVMILLMVTLLLFSQVHT